MKIAYFDCFYGISGIKILSALIDAGAEKEIITSLPEKLHLDNIKIEFSHILIDGIYSTKIKISGQNDSIHNTLDDVYKFIDSGDISETTKSGAKRIFQKLGEEKYPLCKTTPDKINLEEPGSFASIIEAVGMVEAINSLGIEEVFTGKISIGGGTVGSPFNICPVPKPIVLNLLKGFTIQYGPVEKELVTPLGAAFLSVYANNVPSQSKEFKLINTGYGTNSGDIIDPQDVFRVIVGETEDRDKESHSLLIEFNVDDMSPQVIPELLDKIISAGASDAFVTPIIMKKGRPGYLISVSCSSLSEKNILEIIFTESSTIGVRKLKTSGTKLERKIAEHDSSYGRIKAKTIIRTDGSQRIMPEFDECKRISEKENIPLMKLQEKLIFELNYNANHKEEL